MFKNLPHGDWSFRKKFVTAITAFCMVIISYIIYENRTDEVAKETIESSFEVIGFILGTYVVGAVWEKKNNGKES